VSRGSSHCSAVYRIGCRRFNGGCGSRKIKALRHEPISLHHPGRGLRRIGESLSDFLRMIITPITDNLPQKTTAEFDLVWNRRP